MARLFYWQVVRAEYLQSRAEEQHFTNIKVGAFRGNVFFTDGSILASTNPSFTIFGQPKLIAKEQKTNTGYLLAKILVDEGQEVTDKTVLGEVGLTGHTSGYHLHLEIRRNGFNINPLTFLRKANDKLASLGQTKPLQ